MNTKQQKYGLIVAGLSGGAGKSVVAVGLTATFARMGMAVVPFKKGPDYIDAGWLTLAAGKACYNLDSYLMKDDLILNSFSKHVRQGEIIIVEGNRGLYDGVDAAGTYSTAELAKTLGLPVLLVVDCTKTTRTVAALVLGCLHLDTKVNITGVVLNRIGSARHERIVRQSVEQYCNISVVGAIPRSKNDVFPQRYLGITPCSEHKGANKAVEILADKTKKYLDIKTIKNMMGKIPEKSYAKVVGNTDNTHLKVRIGILKDAAFQFYYAENLEALERNGAELITINAMTTPTLPQIDALYIGGGFPETSARQLSANLTFRQSVKSAAAHGMPIYAECGGLIYLGESVTLADYVFPLAGIFPIRFGIEKKPQAHGYTLLTTEHNNPFYPINSEIKGHEFRYSKVLAWHGDPATLAFKMKRGVGFTNGRDGLVYKNVLALYTHIHAVGTPSWAPALIKKASEYNLTPTSVLCPLSSDF